MKINHRYVREISIDKNDLKKHICCSYSEVLNDVCDDPELMHSTALDFTTCMSRLNKNQLKDMFEEGYTMMILPGKTFDLIEDFFDEARTSGWKTVAGAQKELYLNITENGNTVESIHMDHLRY